MSGKSLDDVWRKMQAQRIAEQQRIQQIERANEERRERERREYLNRMRMFERAAPISTSSSAGAGGGGRNPNNIVEVNSIGVEVSLFYNYNYEEDIFTYFIYNYEEDILTEIKQISLPEFPSIKIITKGGYSLTAYESTSDSTLLKFMNLDGDIIWEQKASTFDEYSFSRFLVYQYDFNDGFRLSVFDKENNIKNFDFNNRVQFEIVDNNNSPIFKDGFIVGEQLDSTYKYHFIDLVNNTVNSIEQSDETSAFLYSYHNFIVIEGVSGSINIYDSSGNNINTIVIDVQEGVTVGINNLRFIGENGSFYCRMYNSSSNDYTIVLYNGSNNEYSINIYSVDTYSTINERIEDQKNEFFPDDSFSDGSGCFILDSSSNYNGDFVSYPDGVLIVAFWESEKDPYNFENIVTGLGSNATPCSMTKDVITFLSTVEDEDNYKILIINKNLTHDFTDTGVDSTTYQQNYQITLTNKTVIVFTNLNNSNRLFLLVSLDGQIIDTLEISDNHSLETEGNILMVSDDDTSQTWISNNSNNQNFFELDTYYDEESGAGDISTISGYRRGITTIYNISDFKMRILTNDTVSDNIDIPFLDDGFSKIYDIATSYNGAIVDTRRSDTNKLLFYKLDGTLVGEVDYDNTYDLNDLDSNGVKLFSILEKENDSIVYTFDGEAIRTVRLNLDNMNYALNDYNYQN